MIVLDRLSAAGAELSNHIAQFPAVKSALGPHLRARLRDEDWIKSPELCSFVRPLTLPEAPLTPEQVQHVLAKQNMLSPDATSLDALEHSLTEDVSIVSGIRNWFRDLRGVTGLELDRRLHALSAEMQAVATLPNFGTVEKLRRVGSGSRPDYLVRMSDTVLVIEVKALLGRAWAMGVVQTLMRALREVGEMVAVYEVIVQARSSAVTTGQIDLAVANVKITELIDAIERVASSGAVEAMGTHLTVAPRSAVARRQGVYSSFRDLVVPDDWLDESRSRGPSMQTVKGKANNAWGQCERYRQEADSNHQIHVAWLVGESWHVNPLLTTCHKDLTEWLSTDVWPNFQHRSLVADFTDSFLPVWFVPGSPIVAPVELVGTK